MITTPRAAAGAYQALARAGEGMRAKTAPIAQTAETAGGFGSMVKDAIGNLTTQARATDQQSQAFAAGRSDLIDVVTSVAETEVAMETLVAVRDKVINAYEEILKMPI